MNEFINCINSVLSKFYSSIEAEGFDLLEKIGIIDESIFDTTPLKLLCTEKIETIIHLLILSAVFVFITIYSFKILLSLYKDNLYFSVYSNLIKIIFVVIISSNSYQICRYIVRLNNNVSNSISSVLFEISGKEVKYHNLEENISTIEEFLSLQDKLSIKGVAQSIMCSFILAMIVIFSIRYVIVILSIILSPFFILLTLSDKTINIFYLWIKLFFLNLFIQNINVLLLFIAIVSNKELSGAIVIGTIILMYRLNKKVGQIWIFKE